MSKYYTKDMIIITNNCHITLNLIMLITDLYSHQNCLQEFTSHTKVSL